MSHALLPVRVVDRWTGGNGRCATVETYDVTQGRPVMIAVKAAGPAFSLTPDHLREAARELSRLAGRANDITDDAWDRGEAVRLADLARRCNQSADALAASGAA